MSTFLTGGTGYLGSYVVDRLLAQGEPVTVLVRAGDADKARARLWKALQFHMDADALVSALDEGRLRFVRGDITAPRLGLSAACYERVVDGHDVVVHVAASLNRRSARSCFDVNLRGGLTVLQLARRMAERGALSRYVHVSTAAVAGHIKGRAVDEDEGLDWNRSDWDPYARTKKFGEHLVDELLGDGPVVVVRPSIILGDSRRPETTQFDMARAFVGLARLPVLPFDPTARLDIVPADFVGEAIARLTLAEAPRHRVYNLTAGVESPTFREVTDALAQALGTRGPRYAPLAGRACAGAVGLLSRLRVERLGAVSRGAALMSVFWPYLDWDVVFRNERVVAETGLRPRPFTETCAGLFRFARETRFTYPFLPVPAAARECSSGAFAEEVHSC